MATELAVSCSLKGMLPLGRDACYGKGMKVYLFLVKVYLFLA